MSHNFLGVSVLASLAFFVYLFRHDIASQTKVSVLENAFRVDKQILTLDISVDYSVLVHEDKTLNDLLEDEFDLLLRQLNVVPFQQFVQIKFHELKQHQQKANTIKRR